MKIGEAIADLGRPVAYYPSLARALGGVNAALLICQLIYWRGKGIYINAVYKTAPELEEETGLTYREQLLARKKLRALGIIREHYARLKHTTYFKIDMDVLSQVFAEHSKKVTVASVTNRHSGRSQSDGRRLHRLHHRLLGEEKELRDSSRRETAGKEPAFDQLPQSESQKAAI
ncbi:MAG: hypothetical protein ABSF77_01715 [Spirochaetia bacterium]|jgi:hypothetical protein